MDPGLVQAGHHEGSAPAAVREAATDDVAQLVLPQDDAEVDLAAVGGHGEIAGVHARGDDARGEELRHAPGGVWPR